MKIAIDLKSDTVTLPPEPMRDAIRNACLGDDYYHEDPTVKALESKAAGVLGKEAAMLVLSGTMGNLSCIMSTAPGASEVMLEHDAHMFRSEAGGIARIAGVMPRRIPSNMGIMDPDVLASQIQKKTVLNGGTSVISIEQTHNGAGGTVIPLENLKAIKELASRHGISVHMDGARIFNAATALNVPVGEVAKYTDTLTFCLSKGLCCPLGAIIAGTKEVVETARYHRQTLGGGMRQAGIIAAAGIWALDNMVERLADDHKCARRLAELAIEAGFHVNMASVQSNMVRVDTSPFTSEEFRQGMNKHGIDVLVSTPSVVRFVTHWPYVLEDMETVGRAMKAIRR